MNSNKMFFNSGLQFILIIVMIFSVTLVSCQEEGEDPDFRNRGVFEAKVNGNSWEPDQIVIAETSTGDMQISALNSTNKSQISVRIGSDDIGVYSLDGDSEFNINYYPTEEEKTDECKELGSACIEYMLAGEVNVTKYTEDSIKFTFSGTGEYFNLTEGEVAIKIN